MATVGFMGPFPQTAALAPNRAPGLTSANHELQELRALCYRDSAGPGRWRCGQPLVLKVDDVNVSAIPAGLGGGYLYHAGCNVTNTGEHLCDQWSVLVGVIRP